MASVICRACRRGVGVLLTLKLLYHVHVSVRERAAGTTFLREGSAVRLLVGIREYSGGSSRDISIFSEVNKGRARLHILC